MSATHLAERRVHSPYGGCCFCFLASPHSLLLEGWLPGGGSANIAKHKYQVSPNAISLILFLFKRAYDSRMKHTFYVVPIVCRLDLDVLFKFEIIGPFCFQPKRILDFLRDFGVPKKGEINAHTQNKFHPCIPILECSCSRPLNHSKKRD